MGLGIFYNDLRGLEGIYQRLKFKELGFFLVSNGVYHAVLKENGRPSPILEKNATFYVLKEDLQTRGFNEGEVDSRVRVITYNGLVDLIMDKYEKIVWL